MISDRLLWGDGNRLLLDTHIIHLTHGLWASFLTETLNSVNQKMSIIEELLVAVSPAHT